MGVVGWCDGPEQTSSAGIIEVQGPITLAVDEGGGLFGLFNYRLSFLSSFFLSLGDGPI